MSKVGASLNSRGKLCKLESDVRVVCDVGYLCANFGLPRPLCSRHRPDVRDRQTSDVHHRLMPTPYGGGA